MSSLKNLKYQVKLLWDKRSGAEVSIGEFPKLKLDMPAEFGGEGKYPCPDELFLSAVGGCLLTTFLYFKNKINLRLNGLKISVIGTIDMISPAEGYRVTGIEATMQVEVEESEKVKAEKCARLSEEYCHITRTLEGVIPIKVLKEIKLSA
jgi:organic hydroperoxide reductase OsmC/OhrA